MILSFAAIWPQPLDPLNSIALSAFVAVLPLILLLVLMGGLRKSGLFASTCGLGAAALLAILVWHMPVSLVLWSSAYGFIYALWPILWIVFGALWLYNLTQDTGKFALLQRWMADHASGDPCIQAILVAFCFGALLEGCAGFGAPVALTACLLVGMGMQSRLAVIVSLIANTAPVAFGALGIPVVALAGVTGLDLSKLSSMVGRQVPFLSLILPAYLVWVVAKGKGLRRTWPAALVAGSHICPRAVSCFQPLGTVRDRHYRFRYFDCRHRGFPSLLESHQHRNRFATPEILDANDPTITCGLAAMDNSLCSDDFVVLLQDFADGSVRRSHPHAPQWRADHAVSKILRSVVLLSAYGAGYRRVGCDNHHCTLL